MKVRITTKEQTPNAITHGGIFHADEVMSTVILGHVFEELTILRTFKVPEDINKDCIVFDIGYGKYDHHQKGGNGQRENGIPYASAGLIWKAYGNKILENTCNPDMIWKLIDEQLIQGIDAIDNGHFPKIEYPTQGFSFSNSIRSFNPTWNDTKSADEAFLEAVNFADVIFNNVLKNAIATAEAFEIVENSINQSSEGIMILDKFVPWIDVIFTSKNPKAQNIFYVVFPSLRGGFNVQCVPDAPGSMGQKKSLPLKWRGLPAPELQMITGISSTTFCHPAGFICGAERKTDAISLALLAMKAE